MRPYNLVFLALSASTLSRAAPSGRFKSMGSQAPPKQNLNPAPSKNIGPPPPPSPPSPPPDAPPPPPSGSRVKNAATDMGINLAGNAAISAVMNSGNPFSNGGNPASSDPASSNPASNPAGDPAGNPASGHTSRATEARALEGQANAGLGGRALGDLDLAKRMLASHLGRMVADTIVSTVGSEAGSEVGSKLRKRVDLSPGEDITAGSYLLGKRDVAPEDVTGMLQFLGRALDELD